MTRGTPCDYHIHYCADCCANPEMTLDNIEREALALGLKEICVLKHCSRVLPNGEAAWGCWKRVVPEQFEAFLKDIRGRAPVPGLRVFAGAETELLDDEGHVNIAAEDAKRLDSLSLSVHWLPRMRCATPSPSISPTADYAASPAAALAAWEGEVRRLGAGAILENLAQAYVRAMEMNPKVLVLAHFGDGLIPLRTYHVPVDELSDQTLCSLLEPVMRCCAERGILWEVAMMEPAKPAILVRANALGVKFCATADAHFLHADGWGDKLRDRGRAEGHLDNYGLARGVLNVKGVID